MAQDAIYQNEHGQPTACKIIRRSSANTRIQLADGRRLLVPTASLHAAIGDDATASLELNRVIPRTPLEYFYRQLRKLKGSPADRFQRLTQFLEGRAGPEGAHFLSELFTRSVNHGSSYSNREPFYPAVSRRRSNKRRRDTFAPQLVRRLSEASDPVTIGRFKVSFVDFEVYPFRTTRGCDELGKPATSAGSGGMDLLLASEMDSVQLPAVGEIKADSEQVGPTFAIIQSLMYASQITTLNQLQRLRDIYAGDGFFRTATRPRCDIFVILETAPTKNQEDYSYATTLAEGLMKTAVSEHVRSITIARCGSEQLHFEVLGCFVAAR